jgi:hypothetical protein
LVPEKGVYMPVTEIDPHQKLRAVRFLAGGACAATLTERGEFHAGGIGPVMTVDLAILPDNFVVEGVVAQKTAP